MIHTRLPLLATLAALGLSACAETPVPPATPDAGAQACAPDRYAALVGKNIAAVTLPADPMIRVIGPDTMVTMDHNPERLNIDHDASGIITGLRCG